jgi:hypothetical protein
MNLQEKKIKSVLKKLKPNDNIDELFAEKNNDVPTFHDFKPNYTHQADILKCLNMMQKRLFMEKLNRHRVQALVEAKKINY